MKQTLSRIASPWVYPFCTWLTRVVVRSLTRYTVEGASNVPATGPVVMVSNHLHLLDPPLLAASCGRHLHPMAKRELFDTPIVGWVLWPYGAFPVRRFSADMAALRAARAYLKDGHTILMFPEGTRSKDARLHPAHPGAAMVALLAKAPVVPVAITGTDNIRIPGVFFDWLLRRRIEIRVRFGPAFTLDGAQAESRLAEESTDRMMRQIAALLPPSYQGAYGAGTESEVVFARQHVDKPE